MKIALNRLPILGLMTLLLGCGTVSRNQNYSMQKDPDLLAASRLEIAAMLDSFNVAAANADYNRYFAFFSEDAVFMGTDATEHWDKQSYMAWAKPFFDRRRTWNFKSVERHIYFAKSGDIAWFDELLDTQMKICRGSGVVVKQNGQWRIEQYVLSMTIPNSQTKRIVELKSEEETGILEKIRK